LLLVLLACGRHAADPGPDSQGVVESWRAALSQRPHIVLYLVDTLRADHLTSYGYAKPTSPFVDSLVPDSAVFENAISQGPWTVPSVTSLMTSTYTSVHGMVNLEQRVPESTVTLVEMLRDAGYETFGFTQSPFTGAITGLDQGYRVLVEKPLESMSPEQRAQGVDSLKPFFRWLESWEPKGPSFIFIHTAEPHWPLGDLDPRVFDRDAVRRAQELNKVFRRFRELSRHRPDRDVGTDGHAAYLAELADVKANLAARRQEIVELYDKAVQVADQNLGEVVAALQAKGVWEDAVFGLISDHGEELLDHGYWLHDQSLHDELIRVPMLLRIPGLTDGGRRLQGPVQLIDLAPTLADLVGTVAPGAWQGRSILGRAAGGSGEASQPAFSERINTRKYDARILAAQGDREVALVDDDWKLVDHYEVGEQSLFDRKADPGELKDLSAEMPAVAESLSARLESWRLELTGAEAEPPRSVELDSAELEALRALGYVDGAEPSAQTAPHR
jgi:arylsulfatase A-like enzyme